jgi:hypothetical protein
MRNLDDEELSADEREAFAALPREAMPSRLLEERVVGELRAHGYLGARHVRAPGWGWLPVGAAAAAAIGLFASGLALGQWLGARHTANVLMAQQRQDAVTSAAAVQRAGSAYLSALGAMAQASASAKPEEVARARETAQNVLHQAANEMVRMAPDDPVSTQILQGLDRARIQSASTRQDGAHRLVWF